MSGREWCTLEEWLQCRRPLCPLQVRHDGRIESSSSSNAHQAGLRVVFVNRRIGGAFLDDGTSQVNRKRRRKSKSGRRRRFLRRKCARNVRPKKKETISQRI